MGDKKLKWYDRQRVDTGDMQDEQNYLTQRIGNIFDRVLGDGVVSGLQVSDDSEVVNQDSQNANYDSFIDTIGNRLIQVFKATADNIQQVIIRGRRQGGTSGHILASIFSLVTPSDQNSSVSTTALSQVTVAHDSFNLAWGEVSFDFSGSNVADAGDLTVGDYYAISFERTQGGGSIDINYQTGNSYSDGFLYEHTISTNIYTKQSDYDLYIKIYGDAVQVATGIAYKEGNPIEVNSIQRKVNLSDNSGIVNYICIKYKEVDTDLEAHPRTGEQVYSRIEDSFEIVVRESSGEIQNDEELLATTFYTGVFPLVIIDRRTFIQSPNLTAVILSGENVQSGLSEKDCVFYNTTNARWEKASFINHPRGILTGTNEVTLLGRKNALSGLTSGIQYMDNSGDLTTTVTFIKIGFAIDATQLLVDIDIDESFYNIKTVSSDNYVITDIDEVKIINVTTGVADRTITLPTLADNQERIITIYKEDFSLGDVIIDGEGAETINGNTTIKLPRQYSKLKILAGLSEWKILSIYLSVADTGWERRSDWTNVHIGSVEVIYDTLVGTFQIGETVTETGGNGATGIIIGDTGTVLTLEQVTNTGVFTNNNVLTGSISGSTALVDEVTGDNKNVDTNMNHLFCTNLSNLRAKLLVSTDGTDANSFEVNLIQTANAEITGVTFFQVDTDNITIQTGSGGIRLIENTGATDLIDTENWYCKAIIFKEVV
jgi:hypothetical protein